MNNNLLNLDNMLTAVNVLVGSNPRALRDGFEITGLTPDPESVGRDAWRQIHDFIDRHDNANAIYDAAARLGGGAAFYRITSGNSSVGHILALNNSEGKINAAFAIPA